MRKFEKILKFDKWFFINFIVIYYISPSPLLLVFHNYNCDTNYSLKLRGKTWPGEISL